MKEALKGIFWLVVLISLMLSVVIIFTETIIDKTYDLQNRIAVLEQQISSYVASMDEKADKQQLAELKTLIEQYREEVDSMVFRYKTLDEILKQLGAEAQRRYEAQYGK